MDLFKKKKPWDIDTDVVVIATRHDSHARFVLRALQAGKHVFVEKPLALTLAEVDSIADAWSACGPAGQRPQIMVGYNRRFAPQVVRALIIHKCSLRMERG